MSLVSEILKSLFGSLLLARFDPRGFNYLDSSILSFWKSFIAAGLILPFFLILVTIRLNTLGIGAEGVRYFGLDLCAYAISWLAFPLLMNHLSYSIGQEKRFIQFMVAYNWSMVPQNILYTMIVLLGYVGFISNQISNSFILIVLMWTFAFTWFVARNGLAISGIGAVGIVMIDFLLSLLIEATITSRH